MQRSLLGVIDLNILGRRNYFGTVERDSARYIEEIGGLSFVGFHFANVFIFILGVNKM